MQDNEVINYIKRAFELKSQECYKQAIEMLYKALETESDNVEILYQIAELYFLLHNYDRAEQYLEKVLTSLPGHIASLKLSRTIYTRRDALEDALTAAKKVYDVEPDAANLKELIKILGKMNCLDEIEQYYDKMDGDCLYEYALACYKCGKCDKAKEIIASVNSENEDCRILLGKIYFDENDFEKSREIFTSFPKSCKNPEVLNYLGLFAIEDMKFIDAIKYFSQASNINKNNPVYFYNLANAYFFNGWQDEAVNSYLKAIVLSPENLDYRYSLAYLYYEMKNYDKAEKEVEFIISHNENHYQARVLHALLKLKDKDYLGAEKILEDNLKAGCDDSFTLISLGKVYNELDNFDKAEKVMQEVIEKNPDNINYISDLADVYIKEKKFDEALSLAEKVIEMNDRYIYGYILGAKVAYLKGDFEKTKEFAQDVISLDINCAEGYYYLALVRKEEKDYEEAIECMKRAIMYDLTNAKYYAEMSNIYKLNNDVKTALEYIKEAESIDGSTEYKIMYRELAALNRGK